MTKTEVLSKLGMNDRGLAELFNISTQAVNRWDPNERLPLARELQLRYELHPELFGGAPVKTEAAQ